MKRAAGIAAGIALVTAAWLWRAELLRFVPTPLLPVPAHEQYAAALALAGLSTTDAGRAWLDAAEHALEQPVEASPWFSTTARLDAAPSAVVAWRFPARRGQRVTIEMGGARDMVFLDLFTVDGKNRVASAAPRFSTLSYVVEADGELIARAQPRLRLVEPRRDPGLPASAPRSVIGTTGYSPTASYDIRQRLEASLTFPVNGVDDRAVQSGFGAARDAGHRRHEGIDVFAPRGTPVIAAVDGWVTRQTTNRLGGNVVWLWAPSRRLSLYYAHLDRHAVTPGERVDAGEVIGYVGNTGNAARTAPHLHFGVYATLAGAVDPLPFVVDPLMPSQRPETGKR